MYLAQAFAELIAQQLHAQNIILHHKLLVPISSSTEQLRKRNYNPAGVFAKALAKKLQCALDLSVLRRQSSTQLQKSLSRHDRFLHSSQLYYAHRRLSHNTSIVLVDDILTTGSTLESAARALISAGARQVDAIVIARTANPF
ncbi:MAG: phosphoribosyltransferase family protein [Pelistega sp.]|nr:phosphoribosyltransferase family protein [Pelistega sp.]